MITVLFFATIRELTEEKSTSIEGIEKISSVEMLLRALARRYGEPFEKEVFEGDAISSRVIIMVNGRHIAHTGGAQTPIQDEDTVAVFPLLGGG